MKRFLIAIGIFIGSVLLLLLPALFEIYRTLAGGAVAVGFRFSLGSPAGILRGITVLLLLGALSYWLSGRLVKARE